MKLILENIGLLEKAEMTLHPLCVIAGENDNGKSTIGKIVFCIIKALNRYKEDLRVSKGHEISELLRQAFFELRRIGDTSESNMALYRLRKVFVDDSRLDTLIQVFDETLTELYSNADLDKEALLLIKKLEDEVKSIIATPEDAKQVIEQAFTNVFAAEFDSDVLLVGATQGKIQLWENDICLIDLQVHENNYVTLLSDVEPIEFKDATFIETPLILNFHDVLRHSQTLLERNNQRHLGALPYTTLHTKDLFDKLKQPTLGQITENTQQLLDTVNEIIQGHVSYNRESKDFVFVRGERSISIKNTASGIKSFGVLQVLLANDFINKNTLLILDEPENHLHPKWQIKFAELLVTLAANGLFIVVSVHSPYMIEALERFSEKLNIRQHAKFYLAKENKIEDTDELEEIFSLLAEPFQTFKEMDAEVLRDE